jgi:hypothetical protein
MHAEGLVNCLLLVSLTYTRAVSDAELRKTTVDYALDFARVSTAAVPAGRSRS